MSRITASEPSGPDRPSSTVYLIGKDAHGCWIAQDRQHRHGGLFAGRDDALRYVRRECGATQPTIVFVTGDMELDLGPSRRDRAGGGSADLRRRA